MTKVKVWDYPVRVFHWSLVVCFFAAIGLATFADEHSPTFDIHKLFGLIIGPMAVLRIVWGVIGTKHTRFTSFNLSPTALKEYLAGLVTLRGKRYVGHNPAASYSIAAMLALALATVTSGLLMRRGEVFEEAHEVAAYAMLAVVAAHIAGVVLHVARHKENIILGMLTGKKESEEADAIPSSRPVVALLFLVLMGGWTIAVFRGFDQKAKRVEIPFINATLDLGEEDDEHRRHDDDDGESH